MTVLSIITANVPLLRPFLNKVQSGLIDPSMPKFSSAYQLSILSRGRKYLKQSSGDISGTQKRGSERVQRQLSNSNTPLAMNSMAPWIDNNLDAEDESVSRESDMIGFHV